MSFPLRRLVNPVWLILVMLAFANAAAAISADEIDFRAFFVDSIPRGASVYFDGVLQQQETPLIIRVVRSGVHAIEIRKPTYRTQVLHTQPTGSSVESFVAELVPTGISLNLPREQRAVVGGATVSAGERDLHLSSSSFQVTRDGDSVFVDPNPRLRRWTDGLNIAIPVALAVGGLVTYDAIARSPVDSPGLPPSVVAMHSAIGGLMVLDVALHVAKWRQMQAFFVVSDIRGDPQTERQILRDADAQLEDGRLESARALYEGLVTEFPGSLLVPAALHRQAGINYLLGDVVEAARLYDIIVGDHPVPEFYDVSLKNLADIAARRSDFEDALRYLANITYFGSPYSYREIRSYAQSIASEWLSEDPSQWMRVGSLLAALRPPVFNQSVIGLEHPDGRGM